jgi:hypothetical protein
MGLIAEDRPSTILSAGDCLTVSLKDAVRIFREWNSGSIPVRVFFLGKVASSDSVRVSMNGHVTLVDPHGVVTVSGGGREIKLDLNVCEFSIARNSIEHRDLPQLSELDPALHLSFPNGAICLIAPGTPDSMPRPATGSSGPFQWLRNKLASPVVRPNPVMDPPAENPTEGPAKRNLCVDVHRGQASIVEILDTRNGGTRIRRLREQYLSRADRAHADRLKRKIAYGENGGTYELDGIYSPQTIVSFGELLQLIEGLERRDGSQAWDRRRYPR